MVMEWTHCSVRIEWDRFPIYAAGGLIYIVILDVATFVAHSDDSNTSYASMMFYSNPWVANFVLIGVMILQLLSYMLLIHIDDLKFKEWGDLEYPEIVDESDVPEVVEI